ncbi:MAG: hypothetical protein IKL44_03790 [Clostridia bacterium]|nr:hypothetical protein [Clostridia bacterium]
MKKLSALLLALLLIFSLCACGSETTVIRIDDTSSETENTDAPSSSEPANDKDDKDDKPVSSKEEESSKPSTDKGDGKNEHTHDYKTKTVAATCTKKGSVTYTCACGDTYTEEIDFAHNFSGDFCTKCDRINPEKVFDYLSNVIKSKGSDGAAMSSEYLMAPHDVYIILDYYNNFVLRKSGFDNGNKFSYEINITKATYKIEYATKSESGKFDIAKLTKTTKVCKDAELDNLFHTLLSLTDSCFKNEGVKLTLADLGFKAY